MEKKQSVFRAETSGVILKSCSSVQWVNLYHYCTIKWFIVIDIRLNGSHNSGYSMSQSHFSASTIHARLLEERETLREAHWEHWRIPLLSEWEGLLDLCDTRLRFVLLPWGDVLGMSSWVETLSRSQDMLEWFHFLSIHGLLQWYPGGAGEGGWGKDGLGSSREAAITIIQIRTRKNSR